MMCVDARALLEVRGLIRSLRRGPSFRAQGPVGGRPRRRQPAAPAPADLIAAALHIGSATTSSCVRIIAPRSMGLLLTACAAAAGHHAAAFTPITQPNMNGKYLLSSTPGAPSSTWSTSFKDYPGGVESFTVYTDPITSTYGEVFWKALPEVPLPDEIIERFKGKGKQPSRLPSLLQVARRHRAGGGERAVHIR